MARYAVIHADVSLDTGLPRKLYEHWLSPSLSPLVIRPDDGWRRPGGGATDGASLQRMVSSSSSSLEENCCASPCASTSFSGRHEGSASVAIPESSGAGQRGPGFDRDGKEASRRSCASTDCASHSSMLWVRDVTTQRVLTSLSQAPHAIAA